VPLVLGEKGRRPLSSHTRRHLRFDLHAGASSNLKAAVRTHRSEPDPVTNFVCVCFGGVIKVKFSTMGSLKKKLSKIGRWLGSGFCCTGCTVNVSICSKQTEDNHAVNNNYNYYGSEGEIRDGSQGGGSQGEALPDLISM
jgi:hypothetical protein